jgi:hypothetical protein
LAGDSEPLPAECLIISQGDDKGGPTNEIRVFQGINGQAGYRAWIAFPIERDIHGKIYVQTEEGERAEGSGRGGKHF